MALEHAFLLDDNYNITAVFEDFLSLEWSRSFYIPAGAFSMQINLNQLNAAAIEKGTFIGVTDSPKRRLIDKVLRVEQIVYNVGPEGSLSEALQVTGRDISGMLEERLCLPAPTEAYDELTGPVETVMKHYVDANAGPGAAAERQVPGLTVAPDLGRGEVITFQARYQTVAEVLESLARARSIGWEVNFDIDSGMHVFDAIVGVDRTIDSLTPVVFDTELDTIVEQEYLTSVLGQKNYAYVGGDGQGASRTVVERSYLGGSTPSGMNRRELFVDQQEATDTAMLNLQADAAMAETVQEDLAQAMVSQVGQFLYRRDWDLGDVVTVRNRKWNMEIDMRIVGVRNIIETGAPEIRHEVILNQPFPTLKDRIIAQWRLAEAGRRI